MGYYTKSRRRPYKKRRTIYRGRSPLSRGRKVSSTRRRGANKRNLHKQVTRSRNLSTRQKRTIHRVIRRR